MDKIYQTTLESPVEFQGVGLHSGISSKINILPSEANSGIYFVRVDLKENNLVEANYQKVSSAKLCTTLENEFGVKVSTVEHLLAALYIAGIDNAKIEINSEEVPIMDGSAKNFLDVLKESKIRKLSKKRKFLKILNKVELKDGNRSISIEPNDHSLEVEFQLNYKNQVIGNQKNLIDFNNDNLKDVSSSRTFCLFEDIEKIKKIGLAKGGSLDNAIVVKDNDVLNEGGLRNEKEFVNHKILDLVGDFLLSGHRIIGKVKCHQGGHELTNMFLRKLFSSNIDLNNSVNNNNEIHKKISVNSPIKIAASA